MQIETSAAKIVMKMSTSTWVIWNIYVYNVV